MQISAQAQMFCVGEDMNTEKEAKRKKVECNL